MAVEMEQAVDTHRAVMVIIETRMALGPKRKRRCDAGKPKTTTVVGNSGTLYEEADEGPTE